MPLLLTLNRFHTLLWWSIVDFDQVNVSWPRNGLISWILYWLCSKLDLKKYMPLLYSFVASDVRSGLMISIWSVLQRRSNQTTRLTASDYNKSALLFSSIFQNHVAIYFSYFSYMHSMRHDNNHFKDTQKAFDDFKKYAYSESVFNTLYIEIKHKC